MIRKGISISDEYEYIPSLKKNILTIDIKCQNYVAESCLFKAPSSTVVHEGASLKLRCKQNIYMNALAINQDEVTFQTTRHRSRPYSSPWLVCEVV